MVGRQQDRPSTAAHRDQARPAAVRSALLDRNTPRRRRAHRVRFQDLEEDAGGAAPGGRAVPERHRLGAGPGSPHPNRKSPPAVADSGSVVVGVVWDNTAGPVGGVATVLARVPPHPLTPGPARRPLAPPPPLPLSVTRTHSHSLEDVVGTEGPEDRMKRATPNRLPRPVAAPLQPISPPLPPLRTDSSHCSPVSMVTGSNGPAQIRRPRLGRALSDPGNEDLPRPAPPHAAPPCVAPPTAENTERGVERGAVKQTQLPLPPLPPPPPPYCSAKEGSCRAHRNHSPPMPRPPYTPPMPRPHSTPPTPSKVAPARGGIEREKWGGRITNTPNPAPNPNPAPRQQPDDSRGTVDPPLTPDQARTLEEVERLLGGLVSGDRVGGGPKGGLLGPRGPVRDVRGLKARLQSLEGLLEASHNTVRLLLLAVRDLELKEGQSERKTSYRTSQEGHGNSTDNSCVIYSVENDFRLQEGIFTRRWMKADSQISDPSSSPAIPPTPPNSDPRQEEPSLLAPPPFTDRLPHTGRPPRPARKSRRKCFWFL